MLTIAERRVGGRARLVHADLTRPLPFEDASFDLVLASLVMHYMADWGPTLTRISPPFWRRGDQLVLSTHHPFMDHTQTGHDDYFATYDFSETWTRGGRQITMRFWHRPLHAMIEAIQAAGFRIDVVSEPQPEAKAKMLFPTDFKTLSTKPRFIFFAATKGHVSPCLVSFLRGSVGYIRTGLLRVTTATT